MSSPSWIQALKALSRKEPTVEEFAILAEEAKAGKSERGIALSMSAVAEAGLKAVLMRKLIPLSNSELDGLFGRDAPLSTFSSLIRISHAFGVIDVEVRRDLDRIREIRNAFAHAIVPVTFATPEIIAACDDFIVCKHYYRPAKPTAETARAKFLAASAQLFQLFGNTAKNPSVRWPVRYHSLDG